MVQGTIVLVSESEERFKLDEPVRKLLYQLELAAKQLGQLKLIFNVPLEELRNALNKLTVAYEKDYGHELPFFLNERTQTLEWKRPENGYPIPKYVSYQGCTARGAHALELIEYLRETRRRWCYAGQIAHLSKRP